MRSTINENILPELYGESGEERRRIKEKKR
jgi:hypothetical protein